MNAYTIKDNGGRRSDFDMRQFSYAGHIPERRSGKERRSGLDRRKVLDRRVLEDRRKDNDAKKEQDEIGQLIEMRHFIRRCCPERRAALA